MLSASPVHVAPHGESSAPSPITRELAAPAVGHRIDDLRAETNVASACAGLGLIQVPRYRVAEEIERGLLTEVLADVPPTPLPVHVLFSPARQLSPRLRVVIEWMAEQYRLLAGGR